MNSRKFARVTDLTAEKIEEKEKAIETLEYTWLNLRRTKEDHWERISQLEVKIRRDIKKLKEEMERLKEK